LSLTMPKSENSNSGLKLPLPELSDSFIQFKNSSSPTECGDSTEPSIEPQGALRSFVPLNIPSSASESESCEEENITISSEEEDESRCLVPRPTFLYIQMQLCMKESLREWLQRRNTEEAISVNDSISVFHQITLAVEFIHNQNLIHRDLKVQLM
jgi:serine/threonine protein kinase